MNQFWAKINKFILFFGDIGLFYLSLWLTLVLRYGINYQPEIWMMHWPVFTRLFILWFIIFYAFNLYNLSACKNNWYFYNNYLKALIINISLGVLYFYLFSPVTAISPKTNLIILGLVFSLIFFLWRKLVLELFNLKKLYQNLLFIGYEPLIKELLPKNGKQQRFGFNYKGIVTDQAMTDPAIDLAQYRFNELDEIIKREKINLLVINEPENEKITNQLFQVLPLKVNFISLSNFYETNTDRVPLKIINRGWFLDNFSEGDRSLFETAKRFFDIIFSVIFGLWSLILIPFIVLFINLDSKGKIIFKQIRTGKDGKPFTALKFRTMYKNAEQNGAVWAEENDPRITKAGRFLRNTRLDEIPQLWNILKGEMSFVGPRPERPEFIDELKEKIPFYKERLLVKPGLTGWAQINFPYASSVEDSLKKLQYDLYYIKHRSLLLDAGIIIKTIATVLSSGGR